MGDPVVPDYSHIPINDEMVDLLADGIIASGAEVLAEDKMKIILRMKIGCTGRQVDAIPDCGSDCRAA
jgi:hypothetical protein